LAREAGEITLKYFLRPDLRVESKADRSPVTIADREAEAHMRRRIEDVFPEDGIVGEEHGERPGTSGFVWTLDPIDGTKSFVAGVPLYATAIGVLEGEESRIGVIHAAAAGEMVYAAAGEGAWYVRGKESPRRTWVSKVATLTEALFLTTEVKSFTEHRPVDAADVFLNVQRQARLTRTWGDAYGYLLVVTGRADVMIDPAMNLWDAAPMPPLLEEAGGSFVDWNGERRIRSGEGIATNGQLLEEVLQYTRGR
jgi:histidinol phosphatase-like enzyme (inositol monophosphatase family)